MSFERRGPAGWAIHPGEILREEFLVPMGISGYRLAHALGVNNQSVNDIVREQRGISAEMAVRLAKFFGTSSEFWMNLQSSYELFNAKRSLGRQLKKIRTHHGAAA